MIAELFDYIAMQEELLKQALTPNINDNITAIGLEVGVNIKRI